jgi:hypothetical protein
MLDFHLNSFEEERIFHDIENKSAKQEWEL